MAGFQNQVFPLELSSLTPKTSWKTVVVELGGGGEQRAGLWSDARRRYNATTAPNMTLANYLLIEKHFNARRGQLFSFPLRDRSSWRATLEPLGTAGGIASTMQLQVAWGDGTNAYNREIYLPESGTVHVFANAVEKTQTTDWTLAYTGSTAGTLTWVTDQTGKSITATFDYYVPVRYEIDEMPDSKLFQWTSGTTGISNGPELPLIEVRYTAEF